jgi:prolipoprotein diacylglyceryltransferase
MEFTLLFAVLTAVAVMWVARKLLSDRLENVDSPIDALIGSATVGLIAGRLAAMVADGVNPLTNPLEIILVRAGVMTGVAAPVAVAVLLWTWREHVPKWVDATAPVAVAGVAGWHAGCVWRGACLGTTSNLPWAFAIEGSNITRHPVEIYTAILLALFAVGIARVRLGPWAATGLGITATALARLVTQPLRPSLTGGPVVFYLVAVAVGLAVAVFGTRLPGSRAEPHPLTESR